MSKDNNPQTLQSLAPQPDQNLMSPESESLLKLKGKRAIIVAASGAMATWFSTALSYGATILDWLERADFISTRLIGGLRWLFSPTGAHSLFGLFLAAFFVAVYRTVHAKRTSVLTIQQPPYRTQEQPAPIVKEPCPDKWLHEIAAEEQELLSIGVKILRGWVSHMDTSSSSPQVEFIFVVFNGSVFTVTVEDKTSGYISFAGKRLNRDALEMRENTVIELKHGGEGRFIIVQKLDETEVYQIVNNDPTIYAPFFEVEDLKVTVKGGRDFPQAKQQRLTLPPKIKQPKI